MNRRQFLKSAAAAGGGLCLAGTGAPGARPNILMVMTDDQTRDALGFMGRYPFFRTPNMDRLAREGAHCPNAFVVTSLCAPSRATVLTGTHCHVHGQYDNATQDMPGGLPTFPALLQKAGYETGFIGKLHLGTTSDPLPGFDYWLGHRGQGSYENPVLNENGAERRLAGYYTDLVSDAAVRWIAQPRDRPFCLLLWHKAPHSPLIPAERHSGLYEGEPVSTPPAWGDSLMTKPEWVRARAAWGHGKWRARIKQAKPPASIEGGTWKPDKQEGALAYLRVLQAVDEGLGRILGALTRTGQLDNTFIVFTSDNGLSKAEHHKSFYSKMLMWEQPMGVPLLVRYPQAVKPGTRIDGMVLNLDFAQTFLDLAGVPAPATMQGRSFVPLLKGQTEGWRTSFLYQYGTRPLPPGTEPTGKRPQTVGVRTDRYKYITYPRLDDIDELYDLAQDPLEITNLVHDVRRAPVLQRMQAELELLKQRAGLRSTAR